MLTLSLNPCLDHFMIWHNVNAFDVFDGRNHWRRWWKNCDSFFFFLNQRRSSKNKVEQRHETGIEFTVSINYY